MTIPNALSLLRIFLVAPFLIAIIYHQYLLALCLFVFAGITDFLDGYLARHLRQISLLGSCLDPLGDRLLTTVSFVALGAQGLVPAWLAVVVVAKDVYVAIGAAILYFTGRLIVIEASLWGKLSTMSQLSTVVVVLLVFFVNIPAGVIQTFFLVTGFLSIVACVHYIWQGVQALESETGRERESQRV